MQCYIFVILPFYFDSVIAECTCIEKWTSGFTKNRVQNICLIIIYYYVFIPNFRHVLPQKTHLEKPNLPYNLFENELSNGQPVMFYLHGNAGTR